MQDTVNANHATGPAPCSTLANEHGYPWVATMVAANKSKPFHGARAATGGVGARYNSGQLCPMRIPQSQQRWLLLLLLLLR